MSELNDLKELALLAREEGDEELELKALERIIFLESAPEEITGGGRTGRARQRQKLLAGEREAALSQLTPERRALLESISPTEAALIGMGRGFTDVARGVGLMDEIDSGEREVFQQLESLGPEAGIGQVAGQAAPFVPAGLGVAGIASTPLRVGATAGLGGSEGAIIARGEGADEETQLKSAGVGAVVASALELGLPIIGRLGGKIIRRVSGKNPTAPVVNAAGEPSEELLEALAKDESSFGDLIRTAQEEIAGQTDEALTAFSPVPRTVDAALRDAAPSIGQLKAQARSIYKRIDDLGATISPNSFDSFVDATTKKLNLAGFDADLHPKANAVLNRLVKEKGAIKTTTDIDTLRKVAQGAAASIEPDEKRIGTLILGSIDDFMDNLKSDDFVGGQFSGIGKEYKEARKLWTKARKSELIHEAVQKAKDQASGLENGLRVQFRSILNSKKKSRGFSDDELSAMRKVVQGTRMSNMAKFLGRFGINEQQATSMLGASVGAGGGAAVGSALGGAAGAGVGAVAVPVIGQVSKNLAQKLTKNNAVMADTIIRAGKDGKKIVQAYFNAVEPKQRNAAELAQLLMRPDISLAAIKRDAAKSGANARLIDDAVYMIEKLGAPQLRQVFGLTGAAASAQALGEEDGVVTN